MTKTIISNIDDEIRIAKDGSYIEVPWYEAYIFEDMISEKIKKLINLTLNDEEISLLLEEKENETKGE